MTGGRASRDKGMSEFQLQCAVVEHLRLRAAPNVYFCAIPMGENRNAVTGARIKRMGGKAGAPDLLFIIDGVACGLELKAGRGKLSAAQQETAWAWMEAGGVYHVARNLDDALELLTMWGALAALRELRDEGLVDVPRLETVRESE